MQGSSGIIPKEELGDIRRWQIAGFGEKPAEPVVPATQTEPEAAQVEVGEMAPNVALPTAEDIERVYEEARASGYVAGLEEGQQQARLESEEATRAVAQRLAELVENARLSLADLDQTVADGLLDLAVEIAAQTVRGTLKVKKDVLLPVIREAISALPLHHAHIVVHLHPDDVSAVRERIGEAFFQSGGQIIEAPELTPGGCKVVAGTSQVDATMETRWKRVLESIGLDSATWLAEK